VPILHYGADSHRERLVQKEKKTMSERRLIRARWVFPTDAVPIENGTVELADGMVAGISDRPAAGAEDLGNVAIIPGLVNVHTHLEFSHLRQPLAADGTFAQWIGSVIAERGGRRTPLAESRALGLAESRDSGVAAIGEIATSLWRAAEIPPETPPLHIFREVLGLNPDTVSERLADLETHLAESADDPQGVQRGISPHAPYSIHPDLLEGAIRLARRHDCAVAMHLAETTEELELLRDGTGPLVDLFHRMGIWRPEVVARGTRPLDLLRRLADAPRALVIHGNYLDDEELAFVASRPQMTVVYCPQTHRHFRHAAHPLPRLMAAGARVALGTDSRASSASLNPWDDLRIALRAFPEISPAALFDLATRGGAEALGFRDLGRLGPGFPARLAVVDLAGAENRAPWEALFAEETRSRRLPENPR